MRSFHSLALPVRLSLPDHMKRLHSMLGGVGRQLVQGIADAVAGTVRDLVLGLLAERQGHGHMPIRRPVPTTQLPQRPSSLWDGQEDLDEPYAQEWLDDPEEAEDWTAADDQDEDEAPEPGPGKQPVTQTPTRLVRAIALGLQASAWWLRRKSGRFMVLTAAGVGLAAALAAYMTSPLIGSVLGLLALADAARIGAATLAGILPT